MARPLTETNDAPIAVFTREVARDPYPTYQWLRDRHPIYLEPQLKTYLVSRWDDVVAVLTDWKTFTSTHGVTPEQDQYEKPETLPPEEESSRRFPMLTDDPPRHNRLRKLVNQAFTLRRIEGLKSWMRELLEELLAPIADGESFDAVDRLAGPLPMTVIGQMLGVPREDRDRFRQWAEAFFVDSGDPQDAKAAAMGMAQRFIELIAERTVEPRDDLITALVRAKVDGESLDPQTVLVFCFEIITGGNETTTHLVSNMLDILADRPELWQRLRADRSLVEPMIEEALRFESPSQVMWRAATRDVEMHGVVIPKDAKVGVIFASANRDPRHFTDADEFRIDRAEGEHVAFGYGVHYCLGAPLSRTEAGVALNVLLDRYARIERGDGAPERVRSSILRGFRSLPLRLYT